MKVVSQAGSPGVWSISASMYRTPCWWVYRPVCMQARLGMHTVFCTYARSQTTLLSASWSMLGVRACALPYAPMVSKRC